MTRSFRDPSGSCWLTKEKVFRILDATSAAACDAFLQTQSAQAFVNNGQLIRSWRPPDQHMPGKEPLCAGHALFEHERVRFPSYPYEWPPQMLWAAGRLTLELATDALEDNYSLKDATPFNVLFRGPHPVFIDLPSFELRNQGDPVWQPYAQFVRTFLLPLLAHERWGISLADVFLGHRDGLEPENVYRLCSASERFKPQILSLVSFPTWLRGGARAKGASLYQKQLLSNPEKARFILQSLLKRLYRSLERLRPKTVRNSTWSEYMSTHSYNEPAFAVKEKFVGEVLAEFKPGLVLDAGANTGHFSAMAAKSGAEVLAVDLDPACVGAIWERARDENLNVLPLVMDLSRPAPALGWRNAECPSFLERTTGKFDCVLMLALIHHLLVTERIPLDEILALAASFTRNVAVIELVLPQDPMFQQLTRGRDALHRDFSQQSFEKAVDKYFVIVRSTEIPGTHRRLYGLRRRGEVS